MRIKTESQMVGWLKKIFSLQFLTVLLTAVGLWFTYTTFNQDKSGVLQLTTSTVKLDKKITTIIYGFEIDSDSIIIMDLPMIPILGNLTSNTIEDITVIALIPEEFRSVPNPPYYVETSPKNDLFFGKITCGFKIDKITPMDVVPWPVKTIYPNQNEILLYPIQLHYSYKTQDMTYILLYLIGLPNSHGKLSSADLEKKFIKTIRHALLSVKDINKTAIFFKDKVVQSPSLKKVQQNKIVYSNILDLK